MLNENGISKMVKKIGKIALWLVSTRAGWLVLWAAFLGYNALQFVNTLGV